MHRIDVPLGAPLGRDLGKWMIRQGLYARGPDFSANKTQDPAYRGSSTLLKLWKGVVGSSTDGMVGMRIFLLAHGGKAQGVVTWTHSDTNGVPGNPEWFDKTPNHPRHHPTERVKVCRLGHVMAFVKPDFRGKGLVRKAVRELVLPEAELIARKCARSGILPVLGASNAMWKIVQSSTGIPTVEPLLVCRGMRDDVWSILNWARMHPERRCIHRPYLVQPEPCPRPARMRERPLAATP